MSELEERLRLIFNPPKPPKPDAATLARMVQTYIDEAGVSQREAAKKLGASEALISQLLTIDRLIIPELREALKGTDVGAHTVYQVVRKSPLYQREFAQLVKEKWKK